MIPIPEFEVLRSKRRSIALEINAYGKLVVKAPFFVPMFIINQNIKMNLSWIEKRLKVVHESHLTNSQTLKDGDEYLYLGDIYKLHRGNYKEIVFTKGILYFPNYLEFRGKKEIKGWLLQKGKEVITERLLYYSQKMNKPYKSVSFADTISQWGSCSSDTSLHFNWRLIMAPLLVIDYVVVHELAHTTQRGHQHNFWKEVARYKPAYKQYVKWLKTHSHAIHSIV